MPTSELQFMTARELSAALTSDPPPAAAPGPTIDHDALELHHAERLVIDRARRWARVWFDHGEQRAVAARIELVRAIELLELHESRKNSRTEPTE